MSESATGKEYIDSDNELSVSLKGSRTTLRNEEKNQPSDKFLDLSSCASFASCESYVNIKNTILKREVHTSNASLDSGIDLESLMGTSSKSLQDDKPNTSSTINNNRIDEEEEDEEEQLNILVKRSSMRVVMERRSLQLTEDSSESSDEIEMDEVYEKYGRWFHQIEIDETFEIFTYFDQDSDGYLDLSQFKRMLEKMDIPQTHLAAKHLLASVAGEAAVRMTFCQFLLAYAKLLKRMTFRKSYLRDRQTERLAQTTAVDVSQVGVSGAKLFFEAKIAKQSDQMVHPSPPMPAATHTLIKNNHQAADNAKGSVNREQFKSAAAVFKKQLLKQGDGKD
ncbi:EF-hand domain-containing protein D2 homolog [Drosophila tropicalis]|uniref:EF-hand domain-containing protein D2 homolog n=1 Tax=Drosophila tropicalis TaxID=46794 RepID=UPI0035ABD94E